MNHLNISYLDDGLKQRIPHFLLYLLLVGGLLLGQSFVAVFTIIIASIIEFGSPDDALRFFHGIDPQMEKNLLLLTLLIPFVVMLFVLCMMTNVLYSRGFAQIANGTKKIRWKRIGFAFSLWFGLMGIQLIYSLLISSDDLILQFNLEKFIPLLLISLCFIPLQTTFEEMLFRGYLAQGVAMFTRNRWLSLLFPALVFAWLHMNNPEVGKYGMGIMFPTYLSVALIWGLAAVLDDGLEIGIGAHAANNLFVSLFTTQQGAAFETYAVFEVKETNPYIALLELLIMGAIVLTICYRKYNWSFRVLNQKIENPSKS